MLGAVLDRFERFAVVYTKKDEKHFVLTADAKVSEQFYSWFLGFGKKAQNSSGGFQSLFEYSYGPV